MNSQTLSYSKKIKVLIPAIATLIFASGLQADVITPNADSYIRSGQSQNWYGTSNTIYVNASNQRVYMRFELPTLAVGESISDATLNLTYDRDAKNMPVSVYGLFGNSAAENWIESGTGFMDFANAPQFGTGGFTTTANPTAYVTLLGSISNASATPLTSSTFSSTGLVDFLNAKGSGELATLIFVGQTGADFGIRSKDHNTASIRPQLDITVIPEPGTLGLLLLAAGAMLVVGRRRR